MKKLALVLLAIVYFQLGFAQVIVYPDSGSYAEILAAKEIRRYIYLRTDQVLPIQVVTSIPSLGDIILVANDDNDMVESLRSQINQTTTPGGIIIKSISDNGRTILVITGNNSESTLIAAYRFAEHLGVGFDFAGDAIPDAKISLSLTGFDEAGARRFDIAGLLPFHDFFQGPDLWSTDEYMVAMNQLSKMGMNFFGLHNYPTYSLEEEREDDVRQGPEPNVWIGLPEDVNPDGTVNWAYPSYYRHSHSPYEIWGTVEWNTGNYFAGSADIFPRDFWGSDIFGTTAMPTDVPSSVEVYNKQGEMFNKAFGFARDIGVKTAIGTELPLGIEPKGPEVGDDWVRGMPVELQDRLNDPGSAENVKAVYKGIYDRIMKTHHLDYFWLWSYEIWSAFGVNNSQIQAVRDDITLAMEAADEMDIPFTLGHAGWILGTGDNPAEFDDLMPKDNPFYNLWDEALNMEELSADRVKWAATWLEEDWGLIQPQLEVHRVYDDALAAFDKDCSGLIGKGWRTRGVSMNTHSLKKAIWAYGPTGTTVDKAFPSDKNAWIDEVYTDWATRWFGSEVAADINDIMGTMDKGGEPAVPIICDWDTHDEGINSVGSAIIGDVYDESDTDFVGDIEALQSSVVGIGNQERFKYWLKTWQSYRAKDEFGGFKEDEDRAAMAAKFEEFMTLDIERIVDVCDVGEIMHNNVLNWHQLVQLNELEDHTEETEDETEDTDESGNTLEEGDVDDISELPENVQEYIEQLGDDFDEVWVEDMNGELFIIVADAEGDEVVFNLEGEMQDDMGETEEENEEEPEDIGETETPGMSNPSQTYTGEPFIKVLPVRTQIEENETLELNILAMGVDAPTLKYREMGSSEWISVATSNVGRSVYSVTLPTQQEDFEYYLESGSEVFPVTANSASPIYQTVVVMGSEDLTSITMPVELIEFTGAKNDEGVLLQWTTVTEINNEGFNIQRLNDQKWETLDFIVGNGNSKSVNEYSYLDISYSTGINYYRLQQKDFDGSHSLSDIVAIDVDLSSFESKVVVYPNPFTNEFSITNIEDETNLFIYNSIGQNIITQEIVSGQTIDANSLVDGIYYLVIDQKGKKEYFKILKYLD